MKHILAMLISVLIIQTACQVKVDNPYSQPTSSDAPQQNYPQAKETVVDRTFNVAARSFQDFSFTANRDFHLTGEFSATGGKNDINCIIVDDFEFANVNNGTAFKAFYTSDYVSRGRVDLNLAAGTYHIIFDNRKAVLTNKTVTAKFETE